MLSAPIRAPNLESSASLAVGIVCNSSRSLFIKPSFRSNSFASRSGGGPQLAGRITKAELIEFATPVKGTERRASTPAEPLCVEYTVLNTVYSMHWPTCSFRTKRIYDEKPASSLFHLFHCPASPFQEFRSWCSTESGDGLLAKYWPSKRDGRV